MKISQTVLGCTFVTRTVQQFNTSLDSDLHSWIMGQKPKNLSEAARLADQYVAVHTAGRPGQSFRDGRHHHHHGVSLHKFQSQHSYKSRASASSSSESQSQSKLPNPRQVLQVKKQVKSVFLQQQTKTCLVVETDLPKLVLVGSASVQLLSTISTPGH